MGQWDADSLTFSLPILPKWTGAMEVRLHLLEVPWAIVGDMGLSLTGHCIEKIEIQTPVLTLLHSLWW